MPEEIFVRWLVSLPAEADPGLAASAGPGADRGRGRDDGPAPDNAASSAGEAVRLRMLLEETRRWTAPALASLARAPAPKEAIMSPRIPATVVTGFLGAGKTSLIRHLLQNSGRRRLALLINEFGDLGVDRAILGGCGIPECREEDVIELANGCICCTVADDFLPAMRTILARQPAPDHIVIETSGLALPKPLVQAFAWPEVRTRVTVDGVLVVVDAEAVLAGRFATDLAALAAQRAADPALAHDESPLEELFEEQLLCADLVLVNKADRIGAADRVLRSRRWSGPICGRPCGCCGPATGRSIRWRPWAWVRGPRTTWRAGRRTTTMARSTGTRISRASSSPCRRWRTRKRSRRGCGTLRCGSTSCG